MMSDNAENTTLQQLTLLSVDSLASHLALPGSSEARQMTVTSGRRCSALCKSSSRLGWLVRTCLTSQTFTSTRCYLIWRVRATKRGRLIFRLAPSMRGTSASERSFWPTLRAEEKGDYQYDRGDHTKPRLTLSGMVRFYPTLTVNDSKNNAAPSQFKRDTKALNVVVGGPLNPTWAEWFMGFPIGWTDLEHSETP